MGLANGCETPVLSSFGGGRVGCGGRMLPGERVIGTWPVTARRNHGKLVNVMPVGAYGIAFGRRQRARLAGC
jgi:hypothetical protein